MESKDQQQGKQQSIGTVKNAVDIDETDLAELQAQATQRQRVKTDLSEFEAAIKKMMELDISLPLVLGWLEKKGKTTTLPALRRYVRSVFGEDFYDDFANRNGWQKTKAKPSGLDNGSDIKSQKRRTGGSGLNFLNFKKPPELKRANDAEKKK